MKLLPASLVTLAAAQATWCRWVPLASQQYVPQCSGYVYPIGINYGYPICTSWCQWIPGPSWASTPECRGCYIIFSTSYLSASTLPAQSGCQKSCQWLSRPVWETTSGCKTCEQPLERSVQRTSPLAKMKANTQTPDWCHWVPLSSLRYVSDCSGSSASPISSISQPEGCPSWCGWTSASSWQYTPECKQCTPESLPNETAIETGCAQWCQWVSRPAWQETPECAGCESPILTQNNPNVTHVTNFSYLMVPELLP